MSREPLYCDKLGTQNFECCFSDNLQAPACRNFLKSTAYILQGGCPTGDCVRDCQNVSTIYRSLLQDYQFIGDGKAPIRHFRTCALVPSLARNQGVFDEETSRVIAQFIPPKTSQRALTTITSATTDCLSTTCRVARNRPRCWDNCAPVRLLINNTTPNVRNINDCMHDLCTGGYNSLPFANDDIIGIGVCLDFPNNLTY